MSARTFAAWLKVARLKAGFDRVNRLAVATGLSRSFLGRLEDGTSLPSWQTCRKLARALGVSPEEILGKLPKSL